MSTVHRKKTSLLLRFKAGIVFAVVVLSLMSFTQHYQQEKKVQETFSINGVGKLNIDNLHGFIELKTWDRNEIQISVSIDATSRNNNAVDEFLKNTRIEFSQDGNDVFAITQLAKVDLKKKWWQWGSDQSSFSVDYSVFIPEATHLNLENEHGDIRIGNYDGDLDVDLAHGELFTEIITGKTDLRVKHSEVVMHGMSNGSLDLSFSEFETISAGNLEIKSTRTEVDITEALDIRAYTKYDEYKIGSMGNFINEGAYDEIKIGSVRYLDVYTRYSEISADVCEVGIDGDLFHGELEIDHISPAFNGGKLKFHHTDVELVFDGDVILLLNAKNTDLDLEDMNGPDENNSIHTSSRFIKGSSQTAKTLEVNATNGSLTIND